MATPPAQGADAVHPGIGNLRPWRPGQSGNPGGRPKKLANRVKELIGEDGARAIEALGAIAFGTPKQRRAIFGEALQPKVRDRREAIKELLDRGFGRAIQAVEHSGPDGGPIDLSAASVEELKARARDIVSRLVAE